MNVIEVEHELVATDLPVGAALLSFRLDIAGDEAFEELREALMAEGMQPGTLTDFVTPAAQSMPP